MSKDKIRGIGVDDAPFEFSQKKVLVVGSVVRAPNYLEGVLSTEVEVDGEDATERLSDMITNSRFCDQANILFIDGAAVGGFNLVDLEELFESTETPTVSISRRKPDFENIEKALKHHFEDWEIKLEKIKKGSIYEVKTEHNPVYVQKEGLGLERVKSLIKKFTVRGRLPEPIRMSHMIASGVVRGESRGKA